MKKPLLLFLLLMSLVSLQTQAKSNFQDPIPDSFTTSTSRLAEYIVSHYNTDLEKISAAYSWVVSNIKYSTDSSNQINLGPDPDARITVALRRRKGVCDNFASIFHDIISRVGIKAYQITGYTKQNGAVDNTGHSWVTVFHDGEWLFCDPTWDVQAAASPRFFLVKPADFILNHMPFDPLWQMMEHPLTHYEFETGNYLPKKDIPYFNYKDSLFTYESSDSLTRLKGVTSRIQGAGIRNELVKNHLNYNKMQIEMINQDKDIELYNAAVANINEVAVILNKFLEYRNARFTPVKSDEAMRQSLSGIDELLNDATKKLDEIDRSAASFAISSEPVRKRLNSLSARVKEQRVFLEKYLSLAKESRESIFYK